MLEVRCQELFDEVVKFARRIGKYDQFNERIEYLANYACQEDPERTKIILMGDFMQHSFTFTMLRRATPESEYRPWFNGGLIYHGPLDENVISRIPAEDNPGWSVHT